MSKDTFIFYLDWYNYIEEDIEQEGLRLRLYQAIPRYAFTGEEPQDPAMRVLFSFIRRQLDRDSRKYEEKIDKRREAGRKGNEKRWGKKEESQTVANIANATKTSQMVANIADNNNGNVNGNVNETLINESLQRKKTSKEDKKKVAPQSVATLSQRAEKFYKELIPYVESYGKEMVRAFYDYWTEPNKSKSKMKFELEKTWDLNRRLATWANRESSYNKNQVELSARERNAEIERQEQRERMARQTTPEQRQEVYEAWCRENKLDPSATESSLKYFNEKKR